MIRRSPDLRRWGLMLALALLVGCDSPESGPQRHQPPPGFSVMRLEGSLAHFPADYAGRVVAIRFWADWCPFCHSEMKALEPIYRRLHPRGLTLLAVNVAQPVETVRNFVKPLDLSYEILLDAHGTVMRDYRVMGLPVTFIVDRQGLLRTRIIGEATPEVFEQAILPLL